MVDKKNQLQLAIEGIIREVTRRYKQNLYNMNYGYGAKGIVYHALRYRISRNTIIFNLDTGNQHMNLVLKGLEFGTGIYGPRGEPIVPTHHKYLKFPKSEKYSFYRHSQDIGARHFERDGFIYTTAVRGTKPGFMLTKAIKSVENMNFNNIQQLGIKLRGEIND